MVISQMLVTSLENLWKVKAMHLVVHDSARIAKEKENNKPKVKEIKHGRVEERKLKKVSKDG